MPRILRLPVCFERARTPTLSNGRDRRRRRTDGPPCPRVCGIRVWMLRIAERSSRMSRLLLVGVLFVLAGLCEIGGGYLVWGWMRDNKPLLWALVGAVVLALY